MVDGKTSGRLYARTCKSGIIESGEYNGSIRSDKNIKIKEDKMENKIKKKAGIEMESELPSRELANLTGLSEEQCRRFMTVNNMKEDDALEAIDIFMQCLNDNIAVPLEVAGCMQNAGIYSEMANHLGAYNTMRGGVKGYGGFVFEELHAADKAVKGAEKRSL